MKFKEPFESYSATLAVSSLRYPANKEYCRNPIYWETWGKYQQFPEPKNPADRLFFRSVLGYDEMWDREYDSKLSSAVDKQLHEWLSTESYYFKNYQTIKTFTMPAFIWKSGVRPELNRDGASTVQKFRAGDLVTARFNELDKPSHVDLEIIKDTEDERENLATVLKFTWERYVEYFEEAGSTSYKMSPMRRRAEPKKS